MKKNKQIFVFIGFLVLIFAGIVGARIWGEKQPGQYDEFAQCIQKSGAKFYGAFWCPHCQSQKRLFGNSAKLLPYEECSTADRQGQLPVCKDAGIESYPTWEFADGTRQQGEVQLATLAEKTGCTYEGYTTATSTAIEVEATKTPEAAMPVTQ